MAKVQAKKSAAAKKRAVRKAAARRPRPKPSAKKTSPKTIARAKVKHAKPPKPTARPQPVKPIAKAVPIPARPQPKGFPPRPVVAAPRPEKKRTRRPRTKVQSSGVAVANWFTQGEKPRPSSFIPAPPRAEAPSLVAAPPASSDRLINEEELTEFVVRTVPVRVDVDAGGGRIYLGINPDDVVLRVGEGVEWDFRYIGGADVIVDELIIEFDKPSPFSASTFKSRRPGAARPHRQLSGAAHKSAAGKRVRYAIRAMNTFKTELSVARPWVTVTA